MMIQTPGAQNIENNYARDLYSALSIGTGQLFISQRFNFDIPLDLHFSIIIFMLPEKKCGLVKPLLAMSLSEPSESKQFRFTILEAETAVTNSCWVLGGLLVFKPPLSLFV